MSKHRGKRAADKSSQGERPGTHSSSRFSEEINTADTLILNFEPPELYDKILLFKLPKFVVLCNNSPIKLIQLYK